MMKNNPMSPDEMRYQASLAADRIKKAILEVDMHNAAVYLEQVIGFANSALVIARQCSMDNMVERPIGAQPKKKPNLTLVHSKD